MIFCDSGRGRWYTAERSCQWLWLLRGFVLLVGSTRADEPLDARLGPLVSLRTDYFPFVPPASGDEWNIRAAELRQQVLVSAGLWPMPPRPKPRATVHGRIDREEYTVERVFFESFAGHYVTGSLYRPRDVRGPCPAVLSPHGHWKEGRFQDWGIEEVRKQVASGAEKYEVGGRHIIQARAVQLARMGCVVFVVDMLGYADSQQFSELTIHRPAAESVFEDAAGHSFYSTAAELRMQSPLMLQTYNSLCALDWLASLPDVDPQRIAVAGGSGGATQSLLLAAIDDRPAAVFAAVMVSTAMQGGCPCENACGLRIGTSNVELAALAAPRPLGMTAADDWTKELPTKGYPELQTLYSLLGRPQNVHLTSLLQYPHNFNYPSRAALYEFVATAPDLPPCVDIVERDYAPLSIDELRVWNEEYPPPAGGPEFERAFLRTWTRQSDRQMGELYPRDAATLQAFVDVVRPALKCIVGRPPSPDDVAAEVRKTVTAAGYEQREVVVRVSTSGAALPATVLIPRESRGRSVVWVDAVGRRSLFAPEGVPCDEVQQLLDAGYVVVGGDLLYQGDLLPGGEPLSETRVDADPKPAAGLTYGYNRTVVAQRAADIASLAIVAQRLAKSDGGAAIIAGASTTPYIAAAVAVADGTLGPIVMLTDGFRFAELSSWRDPRFLPGAVKYGDVPALLTCGVPMPLWVADHPSTSLQLVRDAYRAANADAKLVVAAPDSTIADGIQWLLQQP